MKSAASSPAKVTSMVKQFEGESADAEPLLPYHPQPYYPASAPPAANYYHPGPSVEINVNQHHPHPSAPGYAPAYYNHHPSPQHPHSYSPSALYYAVSAAPPHLTHRPPSPSIPAPLPPTSNVPASSPLTNKSHYAEAKCVNAEKQMSSVKPSVVTVRRVSAPQNTKNSTLSGAAASSTRRASANRSRLMMLKRLFAAVMSNKNVWLLRVCLVQLVFGALVLAEGVWCAVQVPKYCPYHSGIWSGALLLVNAAVGIVAAKSGNGRVHVAHFVLALVALVVCVTGAIIAETNWMAIGTYRHPLIQRDGEFCLLGEHDASRISYIFAHMDRYDFRRCLFELKTGIAVSSVQCVALVVAFALSLASALLCLRRMCNQRKR